MYASVQTVVVFFLFYLFIYVFIIIIFFFLVKKKNYIFYGKGPNLFNKGYILHACLSAAKETISSFQGS